MKDEIVEKIIQEIFDLYSSFGSQEYGERVTMLMHMMQAALWAEKKEYSNEMIVAAFLHDIGHFFENEEKMGKFGTMDHGDLGGKYLKSKGFPNIIQKLVASHVETKRYLVATEPMYWGELSAASKQTLIYQGGPMSESEIKEFENEEYMNEFIKIRRLDDLAKDFEMKVDLLDLERMKLKITEYLRDKIVLKNLAPEYS